MCRGGGLPQSEEGLYRPSHRPCRTAHRKASRQKASGKILCPSGRVMRGILKTHTCLCAAAAAFIAAPAAAAAADGQYGYGYQQPETASAALARHIRALASNPKDFGSLIGAGKAAIQIGDPQAAAGFFARADEVNPRSPLPQAGMGAVSVASGDAGAAMPYFPRALQLGATLPQIACDRGLAY